MTNSEKLNAGEIRDLLDANDCSPRNASWPWPGFVIISGDKYEQHPESGVLLVNETAAFSAAWR